MATRLHALRSNEWSNGWPLVLSVCIGGSIVAFYSTALGALMKPIAEATGWSRSEISASAIIVNIGILIVSPLIGRLADRLGARKLVLAGICLYSLALASISLSGANIWTWYLLWTLVAITIPLVEPTTWTIPICSHFVKYRGLALGFASSGIGIAMAILPVLLVESSGLLGWRLTYLFLGGAAWLTAFPLAWLYFHDSIRKTQDKGDSQPIFEDKPGLSLSEILLGYRFWIIISVMALASIGAGSLFVHFQPMMTDNGFSPTSAAAMASIIGPASIVGRIGGGLFLDRIWAPLVGIAVFFLLAASCFLMLIYGNSSLAAICLAATVGISVGMEVDMTGYLVSRYFGLKNYGSVYGAVFGIFCLGFGLSIYLAGAVYDMSGSYRPLLMLVAGAVGLASVLLLTLGRYPPFVEDSSDDLAAPANA